MDRGRSVLSPEVRGGAIEDAPATGRFGEAEEGAEARETEGTVEMSALIYSLIGVGYALYLIIAVLLVRTYQRTHDAGFIWLGVAVLVWPLIGRLLERVSGGPVPHFSQQIFSLILLLIAVLQLAKGKRADSHVG